MHSAGDDGSFVGGNGSIAAVTDKALLSLLDEVRLSGGPRCVSAGLQCTRHRPAHCAECFSMRGRWRFIEVPPRD